MISLDVSLRIRLVHMSIIRLKMCVYTTQIHILLVYSCVSMCDYEDVYIYTTNLEMSSDLMSLDVFRFEDFKSKDKDLKTSDLKTKNMCLLQI